MRKFAFCLIVYCMVASFVHAQACSPSTVVAMPLVKDGAGQFCYEASCIGAPINSWNMTRLTINGVDFTNKWADASAIPAPVNGKFYIVYDGAYSWSHFEANGACVPVNTPAVTPEPSATPVPDLYSVNVIAEPSNMWAQNVSISFSGDYTGASIAPFTIGPSQTPFTVTLVAADRSIGQFGQWVINGVSQPMWQTSVTVNVNTPGVPVEARALYMEIPNTSVPTADPTPEPSPAVTPGTTPCACSSRAWLDPASQSAVYGNTVPVEIHLDTGSSAIGAFGFSVTYPTAMFTLGSVSEIQSGINLTTNANTPGTIVVAGFNPSGIPASYDLALIRITLIVTTTAAGTGNLTLEVRTLADPTGTSIGSVTASGCSINANPEPTLPPTIPPTPIPTDLPTAEPTVAPTAVPTASPVPTVNPTNPPNTPSPTPTPRPTATPTATPIMTTPVPITPEPIASPTATPDTPTPDPIVAPPTNVYAVVDTCSPVQSVSVSWSASTSTNIASYDVYRGCTTGGPYSLMGNVASDSTKTSYTYRDSYQPGCYRYVVTAINNANEESTYSVEGTVIMSACNPSGKVWIVPAQQTVSIGSTARIVLHVNTGTSMLAAYGITVTFDPQILGSPVVAAETSGFLSATNTTNPGNIGTAGFDTVGKGPSTDLALYNITFTAIGVGTSQIGVTANTLVDPNTITIGTPSGTGGSITVE